MYSPEPLDRPSNLPPNIDSGRYAYLVSRLRNRQITMEEATELFGIQQAIIRAAYLTPPAPPPPKPVSPPPSGETPIRPSSAASTSTGLISDDTLTLGLLALGAGAGLLAAVFKRAQEGPPGSPPRSSTRTSPPLGSQDTSSSR